MTREPFLTSRLQGFGTTVFAEMSALAVATGAVNLGQGFPDYPGPPEVLDVARAAIGTAADQYPPGPGRPELRAAVAAHVQRFRGLDYDPAEEVLVTAGATEALSGALLALLDTGDEVVLFEPMYDCYAAGISMAGGVARPVPLRPPADGVGPWTFDPAELRAAITPRARILLLNTPHNPTGKVFTADELHTLAELAIAHDLLVLTDEVYEHLVFGGAQHRSIAALPGMRDRTLVVSSAGKTFNVTGWKVGWICGPAPGRSSCC
jgi:N-succinyldiaminopimelate aminotransferase